MPAYASGATTTMQSPKAALAIGGQGFLGDIVRQGMAGLASNVRGEVIEHCGHWVPDERPEEFNKLILGFLSEPITAKRYRFSDRTVGRPHRTLEPGKAQMDVTVEELASRQLADYRRLSPGTYFGERREPLSLEEAYRVQAEVSRLRVQDGDKIAGYKVGCTSAEIERQFGLRGPIYAVLFQSELRCSGAHLDASSFTNLAIEGEMAARVGEDGEIAALFPAIELHNLVFRSEPKTLAELIVNNGLNAGVVLPDKAAGCEALGQGAARSLRVLINGESIDEGELWSLPGGAGASLKWLRENLKRHGGRLSPGHLVLTGTPLGIHRVRPGDHVEVFAGGHFVHCFVQ